MKKMYDAIKKMLMKDLGWKILSVVIAIGLWLMVINIENPIDYRAYSVTLELLNENTLSAKGLVATNLEELKDTRITIRVRGQRLSLDRLQQVRQNITATVDLSQVADAEEGLVTLPVKAALPTLPRDYFQIESVTPSSVMLSVENISKAEKDIEVVISGAVQSGYVVGTPSINPSTVNVWGPDSLVNQVDTVKINVAVDNANTDVTVSAPPVAYDVNGSVVNGVQMNVSQVEAVIPVSKSKKIPVKITAQGLPEDGYTVGEITWDPQQIEIAGDETALNNISELVLPVVNVQNRTENVQQVYQANDLLPQGVNVKRGTKGDITVNVTIEKMTEKIIYYTESQVSLDVSSLDSKFKASFQPQAGHFTVQGPEAIVSKIDGTALIGKVTIAGLPVGIHSVPITFDVPEGVVLIGDTPSATVTITEDEAGTSEDQPQKTNNETNTETPAEPEETEPGTTASPETPSATGTQENGN